MMILQEDENDGKAGGKTELVALILESHHCGLIPATTLTDSSYVNTPAGIDSAKVTLTLRFICETMTLLHEE